MANPTLLDMPIARDGNKNAIPTTDNGTTGLLSQQYGWQLINAIPPQQGGRAVKREDFNGALYLLSNILFYAQKGWQWEFDETQNYFAGCTVKDTADGKTYVCIADVSASTTHPSSDTTHWKLSDLATKDDLANYLPLAGGSMTGVTINRNVDTSKLVLGGGSTGGAKLEVYGKSFSDDTALKGAFAFYVNDGTNSIILKGLPNGSLTWGDANVLTDANGLTKSEGLTKSGGTFATGDTIYNKADSTGKLAFLGGDSYSTGGSLTLHGVGSAEGEFFLQARWSSARLTGFADGTLKWGNNDLGGSAIVAKSLGTTGYSKRADGLIEQWGQTTAPATVSENVPVTFPITFPNAVSSVVITSEGNLIEFNSPMSYTQVIDVTASGFKYRSFFNSPGEIKKYWRAIGY